MLRSINSAARSCLLVPLFTLSLAGWSPARADEPAPSSKDQTDNTRENKLYNGTLESSADQQKNSKLAIATTRRIRRAIIADKSLSVDAHNVKIIFDGGLVTLKGPVKTAQEKRRVERIATKMARDIAVKSEITVATH